MKTPPRKLSTAIRIVCAFVLTAMSVVSILLPNNAHAAQITNRSLTLLEGTNGPPPDGGSLPSGVVKHQFTFTAPGSSSVQSVEIKYCTTAADVGALTCIGPTGLSVTSATLSSPPSGWSVGSAPAANDIILTHSGATNISTGITFTLAGVINPSTANQTFFGRISTYATTNATGGTTDTGSVAAATTNAIVLTGIMPESLIFCTGATVGVQGALSVTNHSDGSLPDCTTASSGAIAFDILFDPTDTATTTSQMAASTNAGSGYAIAIDGTTLKSGANTIAALTTPTAPVHNSPQFGLNLVKNTTTMDHTTNCTGSPCGLGLDIDDTSNGGLLRGAPSTNYGTVDQFTFNDGDIVAASDQGSPGTGHPTNSQIFTVGYIVNVPGSQPAGTYTATLTYICTPTY